MSKKTTQQTLVNRSRLHQECEKLQVVLENPQRCIYCGTEMVIEDNGFGSLFFYFCPQCKASTPKTRLSAQDVRNRPVVKAMVEDRVTSSVFQRVLTRITKLGEIAIKRCTNCSEIYFGVGGGPLETCKKCMVKRLDQYEKKYPMMIELIEELTGVEPKDTESFEQLIDKAITRLRALRKEK